MVSSDRLGCCLGWYEGPRVTGLAPSCPMLVVSFLIG